MPYPQCVQTPRIVGAFRMSGWDEPGETNDLAEEGTPMSNITIGRYDRCSATSPDGTEKPLTETWAGWVESEANDGTSWIVYLDGNGRPAFYWPEREPSGAVIGEPVTL